MYVGAAIDTRYLSEPLTGFLLLIVSFFNDIKTAFENIKDVDIFLD